MQNQFSLAKWVFKWHPVFDTCALHDIDEMKRTRQQISYEALIVLNVCYQST